MAILTELKKYFSKRRELELFRRLSVDEVFTHIYLSNKWGDPETRSGKGSNLARTAGVVKFLPTVLKKLHANTMLDIPCGDFHWMKEVQLPLQSYTGADIVKPLIDANQQQYGNAVRQFIKLDLLKDALPKVDVIFCRECLVHLSFQHIASAISNIQSSGSTYLITTHFPDLTKNHDVLTGKHRRLNFTLPPFNWPLSDEIYAEYDTGRKRGMKCLAVWKIACLP